MAQDSAESLSYMNTNNSFGHEARDVGTPHDEAPRPRSRRRMLPGLKRMSSSHSLLRMRGRSFGAYKGSLKASMSCISLHSAASPTSDSFGIDGTTGTGVLYTAPPSVPGTPNADDISNDESNRIRFIQGDGVSNTAANPSSAAVPTDSKNPSRPVTSAGVASQGSDSCVATPATIKKRQSAPRFEFWKEMPVELRVKILGYLQPRELVKCSRVSKEFDRICFDGQLWANLDCADFYRDIPADCLVKIISIAGPFARDLNLRGCVQLGDRWDSHKLWKTCTNLTSTCLEGCRIDRESINWLLRLNTRLVQVNLSGLRDVNNSTMRMLGRSCPNLELLNASWCPQVSSHGLINVVEGCRSLKDLRIGEARAMNNIDFMKCIFERNTLERIMFTNCESLTSDAFRAMIEGRDTETDYLTGRRIVPPRKLKHLDLSRCQGIDDDALFSLVGNVPDLEGLQLSRCTEVTDESLKALLPTLPRLSHLDLEELDALSNDTLQILSRSPCRKTLQHINLSYCERVGDVGMLPVVKHCQGLRNLELDNTRISDLVLSEAANKVREQYNPEYSPSSAPQLPKIGLKMAVYDCQHVTWAGIRAVMSKNASINTIPTGPAGHRLSSMSSSISNIQQSGNFSGIYGIPGPRGPPQAHHMLSLKVFYGYQPTVTEHSRRVLRGDFAAASRLEHKWAEWMMASEEAGAPGGFGQAGFGAAPAGVGGLPGSWFFARRRRRRAREAAMRADEEEGGDGVSGQGGPGLGRRRRARSGGGCVVM